MSDASAFLDSYRDALVEEIHQGGLWPPEIASLYEPESCLKHSGSKEVYLALDKRTGGRVVIRASDFDSGERADAEYDILSRLSFPGIPRVYGTLVKDGRSYLSREYFEGEPLDQVLSRGLLTSSQIYQIARQIAVLLSYLHSQNPPVIHRDIKPQNIILRPDGSLGLTDFGIARTYKEGSDSDTQYMGTLLYAPPEQYGYAQSSPQTDIYALGIVLIFLVTGSPDRRELKKRIADPSLRAIIEKCIAFDPKNRFKNVEQVIRRIDAVHTRKRNRFLGMAAAVMGIILVGVGSWFVFSYLLAGVPDLKQQNVGNESLFDASETQEATVGSQPRIGSTDWLFDYNYAGNLQGNINNGGFAVSADYGSSMYVIHEGDIYRLNEDGEVQDTVYTGSAEGNLSMYDNQLYFTNTNDRICRLDPSSGEAVELSTTLAERIYFDNGRLYFTNMEDELNLYSMKTDGSDETMVNDAELAYYSNIADGYHYYSDGNDGNRLYAREFSGGESSVLYDKPALWLSLWNGRIYFLDDNTGCLASVKTDGTDFKIVYDQPCFHIVASSHGIFAIDAINRKIVVVDATDGEHLDLVDHDSNFCVTDGWVFYRGSYATGIEGMIRQDGTDHRERPFD